MRALCGAVVTAGALIGLGLASLGIGQRYAVHPLTPGADNVGHLAMVDRPLAFALVFLTAAAVIGMGVMFVGLAYHHARREREHLHLHAGGTRAGCSGEPAP